MEERLFTMPTAATAITLKMNGFSNTGWRTDLGVSR